LRLLGDRSKARPTAAGDHMFFERPIAVDPAAPCTISMQTRRALPAAAVFARSVDAGTIASSSGSDNVAPMPFSAVRRDMCFLVMKLIMSALQVHRPSSDGTASARAI